MKYKLTALWGFVANLLFIWKLILFDNPAFKLTFVRISAPNLSLFILILIYDLLNLLKLNRHFRGGQNKFIYLPITVESERVAAFRGEEDCAPTRRLKSFHFHRNPRGATFKCCSRTCCKIYDEGAEKKFHQVLIGPAREKECKNRALFWWSFVFTTLVCASFTAVRLINRCHNGGRAIKRKTTHFKHTTFDVWWQQVVHAHLRLLSFCPNQTYKQFC